MYSYVSGLNFGDNSYSPITKDFNLAELYAVSPLNTVKVYLA